MIIYDRSLLEKFYNACVADNIKLEIGIYLKSGDIWEYVPPDRILQGDHWYKAVLKLSNSSGDIDFKDVELRVKKTEKTLPIELYGEMGKNAVPRVDFKDIPWLRSEGEAREALRTVYFRPDRQIEAGERDNLFAVGVYATFVPQGHHWYPADQAEFSTPTLQVPAVLDFGGVAFAQIVTKTIELGNAGVGDLTVTQVALGETADFTITGAPSLPRTIPPGRKEPLTVVFSPSGLGLKRGALTIQCTDIANPTATVGLVGKGVHSFRVESEAIDFAEVPTSTTATRQLRLLNDGTEDVEITDVHVSGDHFSCDASPPLTVAAGSSVDLGVAFSPPTPGSGDGKLTVVSNYSARPEAEVALSAVGVHWFRAAPDQVDFGSARVGQRSSAVEVRVTNSHTSDCEITDITLNKDVLGMESAEDFGCLTPLVEVVELVSGDSMNVTSVWAQPKEPGEREEYLRILHRLKGETKSIPLVVKLTVKAKGPS